MLIEKKLVVLFNKKIENYLESKNDDEHWIQFFESKPFLMLAQIVVENLIKMNVLETNRNRIKFTLPPDINKPINIFYLYPMNMKLSEDIVYLDPKVFINIVEYYKNAIH
jgi:hypothetical protein